MNTLCLSSDDLFSKWGFNDGDQPDEWLDWCEDHGIDYNALNWHATLRRLVREYLVPKLDRLVELYEIETIHNPIRAEDGAVLPVPSVDVEVPYVDVLRVAKEVSA